MKTLLAGLAVIKPSDPFSLVPVILNELKLLGIFTIS
jgi:hypothetical protein